MTLLIAVVLFILGRTGGPACHPASLLQPHVGWHVAAAIAFGIWWWLAM